MRTFFLSSCLLLSALAHAETTALTPLIAKRHSGRDYDSQRTVNQEQIFSLLQAMRWTASCYNDQPWNVIVCNKTTHPESYNKAFSCLVEGNQAWAKNAPVLILVIAGSKFHRNNEPNRWAQYDTGGAASQLSLQAVALGLMAHQMGGFDEKKCAELFHIPKEYTPMAIIAVGYESANPSDVSSPRTRFPLAINFFDGNWGTPFQDL